MTDRDLDEIAFNPRRARLLEWALIGAGILAAFISAATGARAEDYNVNFGTSGYSISTPHGSTIVAPLGTSAPQIIVMPRKEINRVRDFNWWVHCRPRYQQDRYGVTHYVYRHDYCAFGMTKPPTYNVAKAPSGDANGNDADAVDADPEN
jgi:hypothetical protein